MIIGDRKKNTVTVQPSLAIIKMAISNEARAVEGPINVTIVKMSLQNALIAKGNVLSGSSKYPLGP
jgi:hypothetical protein